MSAREGFSWPGRSREAAALLARGETWNATTSALDITRRTLERWHRCADFVDAVARLRSEAAAAIQAEGIANRQNRIDAYNERWHLMRRVIAARAADLADEVPGGDTGLFVRKPSFVKVFEVKREKDLDDDEAPMYPTGKVRLMYEYAVDTGLLKELRAHEQQAAQELGQWTEKRELTGTGGGPLVVQYVNDWRNPDAG